MKNWGQGNDMRDQARLLVETDWDALIILDACRADFFAGMLHCERPDLAPATVRSPGVCTPQWLAAVGPILADRDVLYFTANPVVDREVRRLGLALELVSLWRDLWGRHTRLGVPSVHPWAVNGAVHGTLAARPQAGRPIVIHYIQPHSPYIGDVPLALARWGRAHGPDSGALARACSALTDPARAVADGRCTWDDVRGAYAANLRLVWGAALALAPRLGRRVVTRASATRVVTRAAATRVVTRAAATRVVTRAAATRVVLTSDHGELLREGGRFGHEAGWDAPELRRVPWLVLEPSLSPEGSVADRLRALGYA